MQAAIDNAKRRFDIDINSEIKRLKTKMNIKENGYPIFWKLIHPGFNVEKINYKLKCPMNYLYNINIPRHKNKNEIIPLKDFFNNDDYGKINRRKSKKVEKLIEKYSIDLYSYNSKEEKDFIEYLMLQKKFDELISDIKQTYISGNYKDLMLWLLNRGLAITSGIQNNMERMNSNLYKNKSLLFKVLYDLNPKLFLDCFNKKIVKKEPKMCENCTIKRKKMKKI